MVALGGTWERLAVHVVERQYDDDDDDEDDDDDASELSEHR